VPDNEIKEEVAAMNPYGEWVERGMIDLQAWTETAKLPKTKMEFSQTNHKLNMFGYSSEKLEMLLLPMAVGGKEALGSMGNDAALAVLSEKPRQVNDYFKQLFAQVTNPPIDPIREEGNLLSEPSSGHCERLVIRHPVLTLDQMETLKNTEFKRPDGKTGFKCAVIDITFPAGSGPDGLIQVRLDGH
jgi:Glutamate synthase central domain